MLPPHLILFHWKTWIGGQWCAETSCCLVVVLNLCSWGCSHLMEHVVHLAWHIHVHLPRVLLDGSSSQGCFIVLSFCCQGYDVWASLFIQVGHKS